MGKFNFRKGEATVGAKKGWVRTAEKKEAGEGWTRYRTAS